MRNLATLAAMSMGLVFVSGAAMAAVPTVGVPEPMSISLLAGGVIAIVAVKALRRK